jgi:hypothetical protein
MVSSILGELRKGYLYICLKSLKIAFLPVLKIKKVLKQKIIHIKLLKDETY